MAEHRENSVLLSLRELRSIEEERVKGEEDAEKARIETERRAREDEIRRKRDAEEARVRAEEDRRRGEQNEKERQIREEQLRLQESERRAQIEASSKLEQARIEAEARARIESKKFPTGLVVGGVLALVVGAGILVGVLVQNQNEELKRQRAAAAQEAEQVKRDGEQKAAADKAKADKALAAMREQLEKTSDEAERAKLRARIQEQSRPVVARPRDDAKPAKPAAKKASVNTNIDDPLGGLNGL